MSRRRLIQTYQPDPAGPQYGRVVGPGDLMDIQEFAKRRLDLVLRDLVMRTAAVAQVEGFAHSLPGGLTFRVAPGHATDVLGRSFETYPLDENTDVQIGAAPPANSRIDLVYASLVANQDAEPLLLPHRRLRSQLEYEQNAPEYDPDNFNVNTERRNTAVLGVRAGEVSANPAAPAVGANEVPLYHVRMDAGDVAIAPGKVTDVRNRMRSLYQLMQNVVALETSLTPDNFREAVQDALLAFFPDAAPFDWTVDDAGNRVALDITTATALLKGLMSAADKGAFDTRTSAATPSTIMTRDASGDTAARDFKPTRQILFPDSSVKTHALRTEQAIDLFALGAFFGTNVGPYPGTVAVVTGPDALPFFVNLKAEDFANVPLVFEAVLQYDNTNNSNGTLQAQLYNQTDAAILATVATIWPAAAVVGDAVVVRSTAFTLSGSGRKRVVVRLGGQVAGVLARIWRARIIAYPAYSDCGGPAQSACPI